MGVVSGIAVFVMIWWTAIFAVLPWGLRYPAKQDKGVMDGTPVKPNLKKVILVNTLVTIIIWLIIYAVIKSDVISFQRMVKGMD